MLKIVVPASEEWDEENEEFIRTKERHLQLEHSLVSLSKWESKWCKPFLSKEKKSRDETIDYIRCMTLTQNVPESVYRTMPNSVINEIFKYIEAPMTATWFSNRNQRKSNEIVTAEIIYYWMISLNIPFECQKWHLNRLLTLIEVCSVKNAPKKKMSKSAILAQNRALNAARRKATGSKG